MTAGDEAEKPKFTPGPNAVDISPNQDGGILKEIIKEGEGDELPVHGCTVSIDYHGTLPDGTPHSNRESKTPYEFVLGKEITIKGWDIGVATMKKGEVAMFTCKPEYAYGRGGVPTLPPNAAFVSEVTLLNWVHEDISKAKDGGILRKTIVKGKGYPTPNEGALCEVHITGKYKNEVFEDRDVSFNLGEGCEFGIVEGIEIALAQFTKEEKSSLEIKPKYAFKEEGHKEFGIPPNATVTYIVELKDFERVKESWDMGATEKLAQAKLLKEKATNYLKAGKYQVAVKIFNNLMAYIESDAGFSDDGENAEREAVLLAVRLNLALAYLKMNQHYKAKKECDEVLKMDPDNVKGLFRRGQAYLNISEPENAKADFLAVVKLEPSNKLAANQVLVCCNKIKQQRERDKKIYANMFEKFAQKDKQDTAIRYGWWDDQEKKPVIGEIIPEDKEDLQEKKLEKKRQLEHLKRIAQRKKEELEKAKLAGELQVEEESPEEKKEEQSTEDKKNGQPIEEKKEELPENDKEELKANASTSSGK